MKVKDIPYERITLEEARGVLEGLTQEMRVADSAEKLAEIRNRCVAYRNRIRTACSLAEIRFTTDMNDAFYSGEREYYDGIFPVIDVLFRTFTETMLQNPHFEAAKRDIPDAIVKGYANELKATDARIVGEAKEENRLVTEYSKLMSAMVFTFRGEQMPLSLLKKYLSHADRETRKEAYTALGEGLGAHGEELDGIYDSLVKVRDRMAKKLGYRDFIELGYYRMNRICYDAADVERFRANILRDVVPAVTALKRRLASELGIERIMLYDNDVNAPGGNPVPAVDRDGILSAAQAMYRDMGTETGEFFDSMLAADALDVDSRFGKWGGGYCTDLPDYKQPFILANFNGTSADVDVVTHEAGHALAAYLKFKQGFTEENLGMEVAETHSMSMEFFSWKYMDRFFGADADRYRLMHLVDSFSFLPYGTIVDAFQHEVYAHPEWTPAERKDCYRRLESEFRPYLSLEGVPYLEEGTRWQYQMHIYESPFYYIDYCFAQTVALQFLVRSLDHYDEAFATYFAHVKRGGQYGFVDLVRQAGLISPFSDGALKSLADKIVALANRLFDRLH